MDIKGLRVTLQHVHTANDGEREKVVNGTAFREPKKGESFYMITDDEPGRHGRPLRTSVVQTVWKEPVPPVGVDIFHITTMNSVYLLIVRQDVV